MEKKRNIIQQVKDELEAELVEEAKDELKVKLKQLHAAKLVVANLEREVADIQTEIEDKFRELS